MNFKFFFTGNTKCVIDVHLGKIDMLERNILIGNTNVHMGPWFYKLISSLPGLASVKWQTRQILAKVNILLFYNKNQYGLVESQQIFVSFIFYRFYSSII